MTGAEVLGGAKIGLAVIQITQNAGLFKRIKGFFKRNHYVLVLGSTGVGKTQFLSSLESLVSQPINKMERTEYSIDRKHWIGERPFVFTDTPGQLGHRSRRTNAILNRLSKKSIGVINVTAWGYHEYRTGSAEAVDANGSASADWLARHRQAEIASLSEWAPIVCSRVQWMLTVANKADLWWPDRDNALEYYENGEYGRLLATHGLRDHSVVEYSSTQHMFYGLVPGAGTFDNDDRLRSQEAILRTVMSAVRR